MQDGTHLELYVQVVRAEQVYHPRHPSLLLRKLFPFVVVRPSPGVLDVNSRAMRSWSGGSICLVADEDMTQLQDAVDVFWGLDNGLVL